MIKVLLCQAESWLGGLCEEFLKSDLSIKICVSVIVKTVICWYFNISLFFSVCGSLRCVSCGLTVGANGKTL